MYRKESYPFPTHPTVLDELSAIQKLTHCQSTHPLAFFSQSVILTQGLKNGDVCQTETEQAPLG
ncbi:MAG: hypothetical protein WBF14_07150, partial [Candidatus Acidiferrales bacterium]